VYRNTRRVDYDSMSRKVCEVDMLHVAPVVSEITVVGPTLGIVKSGSGSLFTCASDAAGIGGKLGLPVPRTSISSASELIATYHHISR
jgi:hypothetical protein